MKLFLFLFVTIITMEVCKLTSTNCVSRGLSEPIRRMILQNHNSYRSKLAKGMLVDQYGRRFRKAANMYKLTWNCDLQNSAQNYADRCLKLVHSNNLINVGENLAYTTATRSVSSNLKWAMKAWWDEYYNGTVKGHFTQMAWDYTYSVGCGYKKCYYGDNIVCHYRNAGNYIGLRTYEQGRTCSCNVPNAGACDAYTGLCKYTGLQKTYEWNEYICKDHPDLSCDGARIQDFKGWCGGTISCPTTVERTGWCNAKKYCKKSCNTDC